jgi:hypothetical protein
MSEGKKKFPDELLYSSSLNLKDNATPAISVFGIYRDGSESLVAQTKTIIEQIERSYNQYFGSSSPKPDIVLLGHSMGGLMGRIILTNPTEAIAGERFNDKDRASADFICDRVRYMVTIATPHDGSQLASTGLKVGGSVDKLAASLKSYTDYLKTVVPSAQAKWVDDAVQAVSDNLTDHRQKATQQATASFWMELNKQILAPHKAQRSDGTLVPVYALGGRKPDLDYFLPSSVSLSNLREDLLATATNGRFRELINDIQGGGLKGRYASDALMMLLGDYFHHRHGDNGSVPGSGRKAVADIDKVRASYLTINPRAIDLSLRPPMWAKPDKEYQIGMFYMQNLPDAEIDTDGVVTIESSLGMRLGRQVDSQDDAWYFDSNQQYNIQGKNYNGSWYRFKNGVWDYDNHGIIHHLHRNGKWLHDTLFSRSVVGGYATRGQLSSWNRP